MNASISYKVLDALERGLSACWPFTDRVWIGRAFLLPAVLLIGLLVIGLGYIIEYSLHEHDLSTYRLKEEYSVTNYVTFFDRPVYIKILGRTLLASLIVTIITVSLAFPYAYILVRTLSSLARKFLLVTLFLPFLIGQVVRAYGWLIILGKEGFLNAALISLGFPERNLIFNYPAILFGLIQYMLPFAVLLIIPAIAAIGEDVELASEGLGAHWT